MILSFDVGFKVMLQIAELVEKFRGKVFIVARRNIALETRILQKIKFPKITIREKEF